MTLVGSEAGPSGSCHAHFETNEAASGYAAKSLAFTAERGEYVPITLTLRATGDLSDVGNSCNVDRYTIQHLLRTFAVDIR